jgi:DNA polymerase-4
MTALAILHVDLDAFYASVEQVADPALAGRPVIVGGLGPRGVVAASSYEARRFGVHSAMPMARARRACPQGVFLAPRFEEYGRASRQVMAILRELTPLVEPLALDEAFLDVRDVRRLHGDAEQIATSIRARVRADTGLVASIGVASTKMVAKIASDLAKPDGMLVVPLGTELDFLHPLDVGRLWGVGPATRKRLDRFAVRTIGDLAALPEQTLVGALGAANGRHLHALAWNRDDRAVNPVRQAKSIGNEETYPRDITDRAALDREVLKLSERVGARLRESHKVGRRVQLKVRYGSFRTITRSRTLAEGTDLGTDVARVARELLAAVDLTGGIRLLGVSMQQLEDAGAVQAALPLGDDAPSDVKRDALERTVDRVRARFGDRAVVPASLTPEPEERG